MRKLKKVDCMTGRFVAVSVAIITVIALVMGSSLTTQGLQAAEDKALVGTYSEQTIFQRYPDRDKLQEAQSDAQKKMQEAQKNGDQQKTQQIQREFYQKQQEIVEEFQNTVKKALPEVAKETGVKVIATQVKYTAGGVKTKDVTSQILEAIGAEPESKQPNLKDFQQQ